MNADKRFKAQKPSLAVLFKLDHHLGKLCVAFLQLTHGLTIGRKVFPTKLKQRQQANRQQSLQKTGGEETADVFCNECRAPSSPSRE